MSNNPYRTMCADMLEAFDRLPCETNYRGQSRPIVCIDEEPFDRARALLAQPEPEGLTDAAAWDLADDLGIIRGHSGDLHVSFAGLGPFARAALARFDHPTPQPPADGEVAELVEWVGKDRQWLDLRRDVKDRILRIADLLQRQHLQPEGGDIHYAWELHDAEGDWQAGGSAITLESVRREGNHYLQTYSQDGPHTLIIQRVSTIEEATNV